MGVCRRTMLRLPLGALAPLPAPPKTSVSTPCALTVSPATGEKKASSPLSSLVPSCMPVPHARQHPPHPTIVRTTPHAIVLHYPPHSPTPHPTAVRGRSRPWQARWLPPIGIHPGPTVLLVARGGPAPKPHSPSSESLLLPWPPDAACVAASSSACDATVGSAVAMTAVGTLFVTSIETAVGTLLVTWVFVTVLP